MGEPNHSDVEAAKEFLKTRIVAQAVEEHISLSDAEIATLTYSEPNASQSERELADKVDVTVGTDAYEQKIAGLLRRVYSHDTERGLRADWDRSLRALRNEDLYVLVMVHSAGIPGAPTNTAATIAWYGAFLQVDTICLAVVGLAGALVFFTSLGSFFQNDLIRGSAFVLWLGTLWALGEWSKRRTFGKGPKPRN